MIRRPRRSETALLATLGVVATVILTWVADARVQPPPASAAHIQIHGEQVIASLDVRNFRQVEASGTWRIEIGRGDSWEVELTYPDELKDFVRTELRGDRLRLQGKITKML